MTTTPHHLILGAGQIGSELTRQLLKRGDTVTVASRRGTNIPGAKAITLDASDATALAAAQRDTTTTFVCTNPPYKSWPAEWPPVFTALIAASQVSGSRLVLMGNLYGYGKATMPMTEHTPFRPADTKGEVRVEGWQRLLHAHERGNLTAVEVRASDYIGPNANETSHVGKRFFTPILNSKSARVIGDPQLPHSWSYLPDIASTLIAAASIEDRDSWGRAWVVPSTTRSRIEIAADINAAFHTNGRATRLPSALLSLAAAFDANLREVKRSSYQFEMPFVIDSTETEKALKVRATDWTEVIRTTGASYLETTAN